jgi:replicative DNA helicase
MPRRDSSSRPAESRAKRAKKTVRASKKTTPQSDRWSDPRPLETPKLPSFPSTALPSWLRSWVEAQAEALQVPLDLPALISLAVISTACSKRACIKVRDGWIEPLNLFVLVALPSGSRKSVLFEAATKPLIEFERVVAATATTSIEIEAETEIEPRLRLVAESGSSTSDASSSPSSREWRSAKGAQNRPSLGGAPSRLFVSDVTPERVGALLAENGGRLGVLSDEGEVAEIIGGRYGGSFEIFLKGHSGAPISIERVGRERVYVDRPALTLGLAVQPDVLRSLASKRRLRERGLLARFLVAVPPSNLGFRRVDAPPVSQEIRAAYDDHVRALLDRRVEGEEIERKLSEPARRRLVEFEAEIEEMLRPDGRLAALAGWGSKLVGTVARIAGLLDLAEHDDESSELEEDLDVSTIEAAITIGRYAIEHALAAFGLAGADAALDGSRTILDWIKRTGVSEITKRTIQHGLRSRFPHAADLDAPLAMLIEHGWIRARPALKQRRPGKPSAQIFDVHPAAIT